MLAMMVFMLAQAQQAQQVQPNYLGWANLLITLGLGVGVAWGGAKIRRMESLESRLDSKAEQLIESKLAVRTGELMTEIRVMMVEMRQINDRLKSGDAAFGEIFDKSHDLEIKIIERISQTCATKTDVQNMNHRFDAMQQRFDVMQQAVARALVAKLEQEQL